MNEIEYIFLRKHACLKYLLLITLLSSTTTFAQNFQQKVDVDIDVALNHQEKSLTGFIQFDYHNNSPDTLSYLWFHIWPNAYKNDKTALAKQLVENGDTKLYFSNDSLRGYINRLNFVVNNVPVEYELHPQHQDIIKLILPQPLLPGTKANITTPFYVKLPRNVSRSGFQGNDFAITQWYPKPAVYNKHGWHPMPYLDQGEFFSEFGSYKVKITTQKDFVIAATGVKTNETQNDSTKIETYELNNIHDFAWFASTDYKVLHDTLRVNNRVIDIYAYHLGTPSWERVPDYAKHTIRLNNQNIGVYPYPIVTVVEKREKSYSGMEYPTITLISTPSDSNDLKDLVNHEVTHNWFYGILASDERKYPWMDEGMTSYYDRRNKRSEIRSSMNETLSKRLPTNYEKLYLETIYSVERDQPIETSSEKFSMHNYILMNYVKAPGWLELLEEQVGTQLFDSIMQTYFERYKFKHPYPEDFQNVVMEIVGPNIDFLFALLHKTGPLTKPKKRKVKFTTFFNLKDGEKYNHIQVAPIVGYNTNDKFMLGAVLHNYTFPIPKFKFLAAPMYAFGSKQITGLARLSHTYYFKRGSNIEVFLSGARFNKDLYIDSTGNKNFMDFKKIVPGVRYTFKPKNYRSNLLAYAQFKHFHIRETEILFKRDPISSVLNITYPGNKSYINQLTLQVENNRILYPHEGSLVVEQSEEFIKTFFTGNYFYNYDIKGGLNIRLFAGKFFYLNKSNENVFNTRRYHFNMTGSNGYEDYTYSNYFVGRNDFNNLQSQQIMMRDGGFKVRTDLLSNKIGKSDNWLTSINLTSTIPNAINPLSILPFDIPLKLFVDFGTHAEAWEDGYEGDKILYNAGLQLTVLKVLNIYAPLVYSKVYKDYINSTIPEKRFWKTLSFSIDLNNFKLRKLIPQSPL